MVLCFYVQEHPKAQPAVVLVLKRLRRRGKGFKSYPTEWEKPGIEPATSGLQDIGLSPTPRRLPVSSDRLGESGNRTCDPWFYKLYHGSSNFIFVAVFLGYYQYWPGGFTVLCFLCPGTPEGSTGSSSGFKASQKTGPWLKVQIVNYVQSSIGFII